MYKNLSFLRGHRVTLRRLFVWSVELAIFICSGVGAMLLRFDFRLPAEYRTHLVYGLLIWTITKSIVFHFADLDRGWWRYVSAVDITHLGIANIVGSFLSAIVIRLVAPPGFPRSLYLLDLILCFLATTGIWMVGELTSEVAVASRSRKATPKRTLIYGAGSAGVVLLKEFRSNPRLAYLVIGFLDDRADKKGLRIGGVSVLGNGEAAAAIAKEYEIDLILIAIPSASGSEMSRILRLCNEAGILCKTVPGLAELIEGRLDLAGRIRDVAVEDLLGRRQVNLDEKQIATEIEGKVVLVTGAAGSIGSELCRQIARFHPAAIVGFEIAESPLFEIDREMRQSFPNVPFYPEIGNIQDRARLDEIFSAYVPQVVYHAAAYKHVPLMEHHVFEAVRNNVFGTFNVAEKAAEYGVKDFVMISSDKAVRPTNVMGATKRISELVLSAMPQNGTKYVAVRFGNVLGSNGSVIPIFKRQIAEGGPVTVTHPEMRRFFMTIPEACQLVLQASAIGKDGQICVLQMGEPVRIVDLATNLIRLSGFRVGDQIKIEFTGIRPGEKLYEEINLLTEGTVPTGHEKIRIFMGNQLPPPEINRFLSLLQEICDERDVGNLVIALREFILDYSPSSHLLKRAIVSSRDTDAKIATPDKAQLVSARQLA
jgi:FlaA1/EpsC-like NDP-sugar epimerase